ncbi:hypothetical protein KI387_008146, partial [Taxus chinensis]
GARGAHEEKEVRDEGDDVVAIVFAVVKNKKATMDMERDTACKEKDDLVGV